jgi:hypothetical protein
VTQSEFDSWCAYHVRATGADDKTLETLITDQSIIAGEAWGATAEELTAVTNGLIARCKVPRFPNEHISAVGIELMRLRDERNARDRQQRQQSDPEECAACDGTGFATIPTRACVWNGEIQCLIGTSRVSTGAVLCDRPGCAAGRRTRDSESRRTDDRPRQMILSKAESIAGVRDLPGLLREYERNRAAAIRGKQTDAERVAEFAKTYPELAKRSGLFQPSEPRTNSSVGSGIESEVPA